MRLIDTSTLLLLTQYLEPICFNIQVNIVPWKEAEDQLLPFSKTIYYKIDVNNYTDFLENYLRNTDKYGEPETESKKYFENKSGKLSRT